MTISSVLLGWAPLEGFRDIGRSTEEAADLVAEVTSAGSGRAAAKAARRADVAAVSPQAAGQYLSLTIASRVNPREARTRSAPAIIPGLPHK